MIFRPIQCLFFILTMLLTVSAAFAQPTIQSISITGTNPTNADSLQWNVVFSEPVTGVSQANFTVNPTGTVAGTLGAVTALAGNQTWAVTVDGVTGDGTIGVDLTNPAGITGASGPLTETEVGEVYTVDNTAPAVASITRADSSPTSASTVRFMVTFSEPVNYVSPINFSPGGDLSGNVHSAMTIDGGVTWVVTVSGISGSGTIQLDLTDISNILDFAGNSMISDFTTGEQYQIDQAGPQYVCITRLDASPTSGPQVRFILEFDEPASGVQVSNFTLSGVNTSGTITSAIAEGDGTTWTITVDGISGSGTLGLDLTNAAGITDVQGNASSATGVSCEFYVVDTDAPEVVSITLPDASPTSASTLTFYINFSEAVTTPALSDLTLITNGTSGTITGIETVGDVTSVTVTGVSGAGTICLRVNAPSTITDLVGNGLTNIPFNSSCYIICRNLPQVVNLYPANGETTVTTADNIAWQPPAPDTRVFVYFDGVFQGETTGTLFPIPGPLTTGQHSYLIDVVGSCTSGTEVFFNVLNAPIQVFPVDGYVASKAPRGFTWQPVDGGSTYTLVIDGTPRISTSGTVALLPVAPATGAHTWYVLAENEFGQQQSMVRTFTATGVDPVSPTLFTTNGTIYDIHVQGGVVFVAGEFNGVMDSAGTWKSRNNIAAFSRSTLEPLDWAPNVNGVIYDLEPSPGVLLVGGNFTRVNNEPRGRIAGFAIDASTTIPTPFAPGANAAVRAMEVVGSDLVYGGDFTKVGLQVYNFATPGTDANRLAVADIVTSTPGVPLNLNPNASVRDLLYDGTHLYIAGVFSQIGGQPIRGLARSTLPTSAPIDTTFSNNIDLYVYTMKKFGNRLYFGGSFNSVLGQQRHNAAAIVVGDETVSTTLTRWAPRTDSAVHSIDATRPNSTIYIGGTFTTVNQDRNTYLAGVDPVFGFASTCSFNSDRIIYSIAVRPENGPNANEVFAGGLATQTGPVAAP